MFNGWKKIAIISETVLYSSIIIQGLIYLSYPSSYIHSMIGINLPSAYVPKTGIHIDSGIHMPKKPKL